MIMLDGAGVAFQDKRLAMSMTDFAEGTYDRPALPPDPRPTGERLRASG
jgi:hypothetical protein